MYARFAHPSDAAEAVRLAAMMFESMDVDASDRAWKRSGRTQLCEQLGTHLALVVVDDPVQDGRLVASAAGSIARRLPTPLNPGGLAGYVQWVCTEPAYRGRGLARQVVTRLLEWFDERDVGTVELHSTPEAERLYRDIGFDDAGARALRRRRW
jgi:GNAT superfamily N-acetyltransferase